MDTNLRFRCFQAGLIVRRLILIAVLIIGVYRLAIMAAGRPVQFPSVYAIQPVNVPFTVCKQSTTWTRPTAEQQQATVWSDPRYASIGAKAYEWTHAFLLVPPDSADMQGQVEDEAGLWTEGTWAPTCDKPEYKNDDQWVMAWILQHRVTSIKAAGGVYTITVEPTAKGFESIIFKKLAPKMSVRFVDPQGRVLEEVKN